MAAGEAKGPRDPRDAPTTRFAWLLARLAELRHQPEWREPPDPAWCRQDGSLDLPGLLAGLARPLLERAAADGDEGLVARLVDACDQVATWPGERALTGELRARARERLPGINPNPPRDPQPWVTDLPSIVDPDQLAAVSEAVAEGAVFGYHCHYYGAASADLWAANSQAAFEALVGQARPGDLFMVYAVAELRARGLAFLSSGAIAPEPVSPALGEADIARVLGYLGAGWHELVAVWRQVDPAAGSGARCGAASLFELDRGDLLAMLGPLTEQPGELDLFVFDDLDGNELLSAPVPDLHGAVPVGGAY